MKGSKLTPIMDNENKFQNNKINHSSSSIKLFECLEFLQHASSQFTFETQNSNIQIVPNRDQKHHDILVEKAYKLYNSIRISESRVLCKHRQLDIKITENM